jgi:gluconokinase
MFDVAGLDWDAEACALAGVRPGELPTLAPLGWFGRLQPDLASRWPALRHARWGPPVGDGAASNAGSGGIDERHAVITVGTSAAVRLVQVVPAGQPLPPLPHRLWRYRVDHKRTVMGAAYSNGGNLFAWARRELRLPAGEALEAALALVEPGTGIRADPRLGGDRPPGRTPAGSGALCGIGFTTSAVDLLAGLMDAVSQQVSADVVEIESTVGRPVEVMLGGGAVAASAWWRRAFRAALAPRTVHDVPQPEVGAIGAALITTGQLP